MKITQQNIDDLVQLIKRAGDAIMEVYQGDFDTSYKDDESPVTSADIAAHKVIMSGLEKYNLPIISEESLKKVNVEKEDVFWLVDPLDGTKEFIKHSDEFTVNIALIKNKMPYFGIVSAPALGKIWCGLNEEDAKAFLLDKGESKNIKVREKGDPLVSLISKSHSDANKLKDFYMLNKLDNVEQKPAGSSLKVCYVADGSADFYPRLGPTMEWDIAAAHAVLLAAGGSMYSQVSFKYGKSDLLNPHFVASGFKYEFRF